MPKYDKSQYTKHEWQLIRERRKREKEEALRQREIAPIIEAINEGKPMPPKRLPNTKTAFVLGNGVSRSFIFPEQLEMYGKMYGCNALYRTYSPDYLVAVDVKMILEISKTGYQNNNEVWTNPNKTYHKIKNLNFFHPNKGWSSGPTALWLASQHGYDRIFILGFDYKGLDEGKVFNNIYADTPNYKKSSDGATFFGNWLRQTSSVIKDHPHITYYRVISPDNYCPPELNNHSNFKNIYIEDFKKIFGF